MHQCSSGDYVTSYLCHLIYLKSDGSEFALTAGLEPEDMPPRSAMKARPANLGTF
jgi:hypothetical protein